MSKFITLGDAIEHQGLGSIEVIDDGEIHRFTVSGDDLTKTAGWYISTGTWGVFGNWKTGVKYNWFRGDLTESEIKEAKLKAEKAAQLSKEERKAIHKEVAER